MSRDSARVLWFDEIGTGDVGLVGGKNASLGEMYRELTSLGVRVPYGFAVTAAAYRELLEVSGLGRRIEETLSGLDVEDTRELARRGAEVRRRILATPLPAAVHAAIAEAYGRLCGEGTAADVAVRSSATAEDLPDASFAGQHDTFLNVRGEEAVVEACRRCMASLYNDRAISYRRHQGFEDAGVALSVGVQSMVRADGAASGVMFSIDPETGFQDVVVIDASYGLGENVVKGAVNPDEFVVFKPKLVEGFRPVIRRSLGSKEVRLVYDDSSDTGLRNEPVPEEERQRFCIDDDDVLELARWACLVEEHYGRRRGSATPMDMEWARDTASGRLFLIQARPETVQSRRRTDLMEVHELRETGRELLRGKSVGDRIGRGKARIVGGTGDLHRLEAGEVLVAGMTDPDWEPVMKRAAAIVTDRGGRTCHAAIVSRELGIPAVVGTGSATETLETGREITVSCAGGETGIVYDGLLDFETRSIELSDSERPRTKIMMIVGNPNEALRLALLPSDGCGLARLEFIVSSFVRVHPMALVHRDRLEDGEAAREIDRLTAGYDDKPRYFVDRLAEGVATIAAAFHPNDAIVRLSDFKTNEYANLIGGRQFEPRESNPMLGFRGACRYYSPEYREGFALECRAMRKVREEMGLDNLKLMIPFCRTPEEGRRVLAELERNGLVRGRDGLEVWVMCEIPSNVVLAEEFCEDFDGFSIGSNDLTQLVLGVDRDSDRLADLFDERNEAVTRMISEVIRTAHRCGRKVGFCGQAPSDHPDFAEFLVEEGIDSISLNPDAVLRTTLRVREIEAAASRSR